MLNTTTEPAAATTATGRKYGSLTKSQFLVLKYRASGLSQLQTAKKLSTSRANVSMIELRAKKKVKRAEETLRAYQSILGKKYIVKIKEGTRLQEAPSIVLREGDKNRIHLNSNLVEIIRMVKRADPNCLKDGSITRDIEFSFNQNGNLSLS